MALPAPDGAWVDGGAALGGGDLALFDWLIPASEEDSAVLGWPEGGPSGGAPSPAPAQRLRCLNPAHASGCGSCLPPPAAGEEALYLLRGAGGDADDATAGPSGSARLRAQVLATAEWNSAAARDALAAAEEARGDPAHVAAILRRKMGKVLLKSHMLLLARAWGYASDLWLRRGDAAAGRKRARTAAATADAATPPSGEARRLHSGDSVAVSRPLPVVETLSLPAGGQQCALRALWRPAADCFLGTACRAECQRSGVAFYNAAIDTEFAVFDAGAARLCAEFGRLQATQGTWNNALRVHLATSAEAGTGTAARLALPGGRLPLCVATALRGVNADDVPAEAGLRCLLTAVAAFEDAWVARRASACAIMAGADVATPTQVSYQRLDMAPIDAEIEVLYANARRFIAEGLLVLQFIAARGSCGDYLDAAVDVAAELQRFVAEARANMSDQRAWYARQCAAGALAPLEARVRDHDFERILADVSDKVQAVHAAPLQLPHAAAAFGAAPRACEAV